MASIETVTQLEQRDAGSSHGGLLAKITRSPSRRHKPNASQGSSGSTDATIPAGGSAAHRNRSRPAFQRNPTAPGGPVTLNPNKAELIRTHSDDSSSKMLASMTAVPFTVAPVPSKSAGPATGFPNVPPVNGASLGIQGAQSSTTASLPNPNVLYQHIHDMSNKRIATLDYMRKAHEGRTFWFNTVHFAKGDLSKMPSYTPPRLSRRAMNYLLLGMSLPAVLDMHGQPHPQNSSAANVVMAQEYLRSLINLLTEFESYQQLHPSDGSSASSLSRARIPQMFKRAATTSRPRKSSGAPVSEIGLPMQQSVSPPAMPEGTSHHSHQTSIDTTFTNTSTSSASTLVNPATSSSSLSGTSFPSTSAFPAPAPFDAPNSSLLLNEGPYTYLLTPPLPFVPDFYAVFATLCDVLIDTYQRLLQLLSHPATCTPVISDLFSKADARLRKVIVGGIVREFESVSRDTAKRELMGVQKVVLGGLMGT